MIRIEIRTDTMHLRLFVIAQERVALINSDSLEELQSLVVHLPPKQQLAVRIHIIPELVNHFRVK